jgi:hypothetical protein
LKQRNGQKIGDTFGYSLLHFQLNKLFKNMVCILALFGLATVLPTIKKILGIGHPGLN